MALKDIKEALQPLALIEEIEVEVPSQAEPVEGEEAPAPTKEILSFRRGPSNAR